MQTKNTYITNIYLYLQIDKTILYEALKKALCLTFNRKLSNCP